VSAAFAPLCSAVSARNGLVHLFVSPVTPRGRSDCGPHRHRISVAMRRPQGAPARDDPAVWFRRTPCSRRRAAGGTTICFPSPLFPHTGGRSTVPHGSGKQHTEKNPARNGRGQPIQAAIPFPRKDVSALSRAGLLACGTSLLSAPSQGLRPQWFRQISFRSQLRGSDGFAPSSLATISHCGQPY